MPPLRNSLECPLTFATQIVRNWGSFFPFRSIAFERVIKRETKQQLAPLPPAKVEMLLLAALQEQHNAPAAAERSQAASTAGRRVVPLSCLMVGPEPAEPSTGGQCWQLSILCSLG